MTVVTLCCALSSGVMIVEKSLSHTSLRSRRDFVYAQACPAHGHTCAHSGAHGHAKLLDQDFASGQQVLKGEVRRENWGRKARRQITFELRNRLRGPMISTIPKIPAAHEITSAMAPSSGRRIPFRLPGRNSTFVVGASA